MILLLTLLLWSAQAAPSAEAPGKDYYDRLNIPLLVESRGEMGALRPGPVLPPRLV